MMRRSFRIGVRLGLLAGVAVALVKVVQSRRSAREEAWAPAGGRPRWPAFEPEPEPEPVPAPVPQPEAATAWPAFVPLDEEVDDEDQDGAPGAEDRIEADDESAESVWSAFEGEAGAGPWRAIDLDDAPEASSPELALEHGDGDEEQPSEGPVPEASLPEPPWWALPLEPRSPPPAPPEPAVTGGAEGEEDDPPEEWPVPAMAPAGSDDDEEPPAVAVHPTAEAAPAPAPAPAKKAAKKAARVRKAAKKAAPVEAEVAPAVARTTKRVRKTRRPTWVEALGKDTPTSHPVKAKLSSMLYHLPGMQFYDRTRPDRCYVNAEAAEADGFTKAKR